MANIIQTFPSGNGTDLNIIAEEFDDTKSYAVNDRCIKDKVLYECVTPHTGAWVAGDFAEVTLDDVIPKPLTAAQMADVKSGFAPTNVVGVEFGGCIYSPVEHVVGKWQEVVDGVLKEKPLYQKTVNFGTLPNKTAISVNHNIANLDRCVALFGTSHNPSTGYYNPLPIVDDNTSGVNAKCQLTMTKTAVIIFSRQINNAGYTQTYITISYTKTTDTWKTVS